MTKIETIMLETITGGAFVGLTGGTGTPTRRSGSGSSSNAATQTALAGVTSALDSLKSNQNNNGLNQMLPLVVMAKWMQNR
jgi:ABC-type transporter Mla subunit MlaD